MYRKKRILAILLALLASGCGVKGDPKPPVTPAALGHGQPSFKRATKLIVPINPNESEPLPNKNYDKSDQE